MRSAGPAGSRQTGSRRSPTGWSATGDSGKRASNAWTSICKRCKGRRRNVPARTLELVAEPGKPTIVLTRVFGAPRRLVFEAFTRPEHIKRWWGLRDHTMTVCEIDLRVGGAWRFVLRDPDGQEFGF